MQNEVKFAGFGGQGIMLMGQIMAEAAMKQGYEVVWIPSYGPEMRGGTQYRGAGGFRQPQPGARL
ncbi:MAG: 2-oxoacid:acceptor oxidoreductase family protein [Desulfobacterales bacterium]